MNSSQQHHDPVADEQAALWAARLDGDHLDSAQRAELDAWLAAKPMHRALLSQYCQFSADLEESLPVLVETGAVAMPVVPKPAARRGWSFPRLAGFALAAAAAAAVAFVVLRPSAEVENHAMASAQRGSCTLADGTRVELNANTSLRFENGKNERRVRLAGGEALFMVTKDPSRPFYIETPTGSVRVTGTTFNVRTQPSSSEFEVTVLEGSVQVRPNELGGTRPSAPIDLTANEQFSARGEARARNHLSKDELENALAWREGLVVFNDTPLDAALARYAHHHGISINVAPSVAKKPVTGIYSIDDLRTFLDGLESVLPVKVKRDDPSGAVSVDLRTGS